ncbi:MAG: hypothetical protein V4574_09750 [Pseudomonadota bacterium]
MVGIFTGLGSGLERGSANILGGSGLLGSGSFGRSGEQLFLNAATGNFMVTRNDEFLVGRGPDAAVGRTYNSLGNLSDENGDNWRQSTDRRILGVTGTVNTTGSTVTRRSPDGSEIVYSWSTAASAYVATEGSGAYDTLTYASGTNRWTWTDGDSHTSEVYEVTYGAATQWRIKEAKDASAVTMAFTYVANSDHLDKVTTSDGSDIQYSWSGNNITQVVTHYTDLVTSTAKTLTRVRYGYDGSNRLTSVTTDLTPGDNSIADAVTYTTTYSYEGSSARVESITQSDGSSLTVAYDATTHKVTQLTQTVASGVTRVTGIAYNISTNTTTITDPLLQVTTLEYNADGSLKKITAPPAVTGATAQTVDFSYDGSGNLLTVTDALGKVTTYGGYTNGNWTTLTDPLSNAVSRTYDAANNLTSETRTGYDRASNAGTHTTRYVYDASNRLIWALSAEGYVAKYDYDAYGQLAQTTKYPFYFYDVSGLGATTMVSDASLASWASAQSDKTTRIIETVARDARGNASTDKTHAAADSSGAAILTSGYTADTTIYDQAGRLLERYRNGNNHELFVYDGLGRLTASTDINGGTTSFVFTDSTTDTRTVVTTAAGYVQTHSYNRAGELISTTDSGTGVTGGTTSHGYDALGRVRVATDANSNKSYALYDNAGRKTADIDSYGNVREYRYDAGNRVVATVRWNTATTASLTTLANPANTLDIATVRPAPDTAADIWSWTVYDAAGRVIETIEGDGSATAYEYDASSRLVRTTLYFNKLSSTQLATIRSTPPATALLPGAHANDSFSRLFYDKDGRVCGTLDGNGYFVSTTFQSGGEKSIEKLYFTVSDPSVRANGIFSAMGAGGGSTLGRTSYVYDAADRLRYEIDTAGHVTEYVYNDGVTQASNADQPRQVIRYDGTITIASTLTVAYVQSLVTAGGLAADADTRTTWMVYDAAQRLAYAIDAGGAVTGFGYDSSGRLTKTVGFATVRSTTALPSLATMAAWASANPSSDDRVSRNFYTPRGELAYTIDGEGHVTGNAYDAEGQLTSTTRWDTAVTTATDSWTLVNVAAALSGTTSVTAYTYDLDGRVATTRDGEGHGHDYLYYANGLLAWDIRMSGSSTDESKTKFVYDAAGRLTDRYDGWVSGSTATRYTYDGRGNQETVIDPNGNTVTRSFDLNGRVLSEADALGATTYFQYDALGNVVKVTDPRGISYNYYDTLGRLVATRDAENYVTTQTYNAFGEVASVTRHSVRATNTAAVGALPSWTWDGTDVPVTTSYEYDKLGRLAKVTDPLTGYRQYTSNAFGELKLIRDERAMLTSQAYDRRGLLKTRIVDTTGKAITTGYTYTARGQVFTATDANNKVTTSTYDLAGRLKTVKDALNNTTTYTYDGRDNLVAVTDALGAITRSIFDAKDRRIAAIDALGGVVTYAYDADGNLIAQTEYKTRVSLGSTLQVSIGALNALLSTHADDRVTRYAFDGNGRLRFTVDARMHVVELEYDAAGMVVRTTAYDGVIGTGSFTASWIATQVALTGSPRTTRAVYDALGRLTYSIGALGEVTWFVRDAMGNVTRQVDFSVAYGTTGIPTLAAMATWRADSLVVAGAGGDRTSRAWYDSNGRLTYGLDALNFVTRHEYDAAGNLTKQTRYTETFSASDSTTAADLASAYTSPVAPQVTQLTYDTAGRLTETLDAEGNKTLLTLSQTGQTLTSTTAATTTDAHVVTYTYDDVGRLSSETVQIGTSASSADLVTGYTYDALGNQVKLHDARGNDSYLYYDALGQMVAARDAESHVTETGYNSFGDVASVTRHSAKATNTAATGPLPTWTWATTDLPAVTAFEYNTLGQLTKSIDATSAYEEYTLGNFGERLGIRNKLGGVSTYTYDKNGQVLTETLPTAITTKTSGGATIPVVNRYEYDVFGNRKTMVEADGAAEMRTTLYTYDKLDRLGTAAGDSVTVLSAALAESAYVPTRTLTHDSRGNLIKSVDADAATFFYYDRNDRLIAQISPLGTVSRFAYDGNGNRISEKMFGTAVSLPGSPGGTPPAGSGEVRETRYEYDRANRLAATRVPSLQTGEYTSAWAFTTADIVTRLEYDATGNVLRRYDGRDSLIRHYYDALGREIAKVDQERYLTVWDRDAEGNVTKETRYATALGSGTDIETATLAAMKTAGGTTGNRVTDFTYDKNGRRLTEERQGVAYVAIASDGTETTGTATSTIHYNYNGLGQVLSKIEANGDTTTYAYDVAGRLTLETGQAFTDYLGVTTTTPRTAYVYDGLNNLKSTRVQVDATGTNATDRVTAYTYGAGGRLATMTDALSQVHSYGYDKAGHTVLDRYTRVKSDATSVIEAKVTLYDVAGRVTAQTMARWSGSAWLFTSELTGNPAYDAVNLQYNAFGDLTGRGLSSAGAAAAYQEYFSYDAGGRLWKSNTGDGVLRFHLYDKAGNETLTLASTGADLSSLTGLDATSIDTAGDYSATTAGAVTTVTVYDKRGQVKSVREPDREVAGSTATIVHAKTYNAFGEVWKETGPGGFTTAGAANTATNAYGHSYFDVHTAEFTYNTMGRLVATSKAMADVTAANGTVTHDYRPMEAYGYDLSGRLDRVTDANGNVTKRALLAGTGHGDSEALVSREFHADTGIFETRYDVFGDARILRNELYNPSSPNATATDEVQTFDKLGRLVSVTHRGAALTDNYVYDSAGQRTAHWNSQLGSSVKEKTDYDAQGRVVSTVGFGGDTLTYRYAWTTSLTTSGLADYDGWVKTTVNVSAYNGGDIDMTESTDYFGRVIGRTDFAEVATTMTFDKAGRLYTQAISGGATTTTTWHNSGLQATVTTGSAVSTYRYDAAGRRTYEKYVVGSNVYQESTATWDALGRMASFRDAGVSGGAAVAIDYEYDPFGNVRHIFSAYTTLDGQGDSVGASNQDYWYLYDSMNRFVLTQGQLVKWGSNNHIATDGLGSYIIGDLARGVSGAVIERYLDGTTITWDMAGNRVTAAKTLAEDSFEAEFGTPYVAFREQKETYTYSSDGYLTRTDIAQGSATAYFNYTGDVYRKPNAATGGVTRARYERDAMGRVVDYWEYKVAGYVSGSPGTNLAYQRHADYDNGGRVTQDVTISARSDGTFKAISDYSYNASLASGRWGGVATGGSYMGGVATRITTSNLKNDVDGDALDTVTINGYVWGQGGPVLKRVDYDKDTGSSGNDIWVSTYTHDGSGYLTGATIDDERDRTVALVNDAEGRVLQRDEEDYSSPGVRNTDTGDPRQLHYYFDGRRVGDISNNGTSNTDYAASIVAHMAVPGFGGFQGGAASGSSYGDFDQGYDAINGLSYDGAASSYTTQAGDTLQGVAFRVWGDASLWYLLAEANGIGGSEVLAAGRTLTVPNKVHNSHHNADTFRPYDPNEAQGDLSPTGAKKPKGNKCGVFGQTLAVIVAVATSKLLGGIPGNLISQAFNNLMGLQHGFDWKSFTTAVVTSAALAAIDIATAGAASALTQSVKASLGAFKAFKFGLNAIKVVQLAKTGLAIAKATGSFAAVGRAALSTGPLHVGSALLSNNPLAIAVRSAGINALAQGVAMITKQQKGFDLAAWASSAVGAGVSAGVSSEIGGRLGSFLGSMADDIASAATLSIVNGTDFGDNMIAVLPDVIGRAAGRAVADEIGGALNESNALGNRVDDVLQAQEEAAQYRKLQELGRKLDPATKVIGGVAYSILGLVDSFAPTWNPTSDGASPRRAQAFNDDLPGKQDTFQDVPMTSEDIRKQREFVGRSRAGLEGPDFQPNRPRISYLYRNGKVLNGDVAVVFESHTATATQAEKNKIIDQLHFVNQRSSDGYQINLRFHEMGTAEWLRWQINMYAAPVVKVQFIQSTGSTALGLEDARSGILSLFPQNRDDTVMHEFIHRLGFTHSTTPGNPMFKYAGERMNTHLEDWQIKRIVLAYPSAPPPPKPVQHFQGLPAMR